VYKINLDAPASERFKEPVMAMREQVKTVFANYSLIFKEVFGLTEMYLDMVDYGMWWQHREWYLEIDGIARELEIPTKRAVIINFVFEFVTYCTSVVAKQQDGTLLHLRVLDFGPTEELKAITYMASF